MTGAPRYAFAATVVLSGCGGARSGAWGTPFGRKEKEKPLDGGINYHRDASVRRIPAHAQVAIAAAVMLGAFLQVLDTSIVNVALPYMQGSFAASVDEVTWVVTSFLVSNGVMIPMTGWIAARMGASAISSCP